MQAGYTLISIYFFWQPNSCIEIQVFYILKKYSNQQTVQTWSLNFSNDLWGLTITGHFTKGRKEADGKTQEFE